LDNTDNKLVVKIKSPNVPYLKNTKVDVLFGIFQIVNILNTLDASTMAKVNSFADLKIGKLKMLSTCQKKSEKQP
jgi:hypothetical protein